MEKVKAKGIASTPVTLPVNPIPFIKSLIGRQIIVKLKWGMEYCGTLSRCDAFMNLQLRDAEEYIANKSSGTMSKLIIRCNNILYIREKEREASA